MRYFFISFILGLLITLALMFGNDCRAEVSHLPKHETKYNWKKAADKITAECRTDYEKAYEIYHWLCRNIAYDTSYTIYDADQCYEQRKGVCRAFTELFYYLGTAAGLEVACISGKSKNPNTGEVSEKGHAWVCVTLEDGRMVLMDPTWGAGSVSNDNVFTRSRDDSKWFDVDPRVMICTHWPKDEAYQGLEEPLTFEEFCQTDPKTPNMDLALSTYAWVEEVVEEEVLVEDVIDEVEEAKEAKKKKDNDEDFATNALLFIGSFAFVIVFDRLTSKKTSS